MSQPQAAVKDLLQRNKEIAVTHTPSTTLAEGRAQGSPTPNILIVTCADPRCVPERFLGLQGPDAVVIRNVCGHVEPNLNDIVGLDGLLSLQEIMVIHHTDCGALHFTNDEIQGLVRERAPDTENIERLSFGAITDLEQSVKDDLAILKASPLVRKELRENASGFIFDIKTGLLSAVEG